MPFVYFLCFCIAKDVSSQHYALTWGLPSCLPAIIVSYLLKIVSLPSYLTCINTLSLSCLSPLSFLPHISCISFFFPWRTCFFFFLRKHNKVLTRCRAKWPGMRVHAKSIKTFMVSKKVYLKNPKGITVSLAVLYITCPELRRHAHEHVARVLGLCLLKTKAKVQA